MEEKKNLKHIAIVEAKSKAELIKKVNDAVDEYGLNVIHYSIEQSIDSKSYEDLWSMELFFEGDMIFTYNLSGEDKLMSNFSNNNQDRFM